MKLDQTFFDLVSSETHLSLHHVGSKDGCTPKETGCHRLWSEQTNSQQHTMMDGWWTGNI
jgi:hypothetical protein